MRHELDLSLLTSLRRPFAWPVRFLLVPFPNCQQRGCLGRRIEQIHLRWFTFPLLSKAILPCVAQGGQGCLESFSRFPDGDAHKRSFFRILKRTGSLKQISWLLLHQLAIFVHTLHQQLLLFRMRIMNGIEDKHIRVISSRVKFCCL